MIDPHIIAAIQAQALDIWSWALQNTTTIASRLPECGRLLSIALETQKISKHQSAQGLKGLWNSVKMVKGASHGMQRALRFQKLLDHFKTAPWANTRFKPNDLMINRFTATHLRIIIGPHAYKTEKENIIAMLDSTPHNEMQNTSNILWITSRQNGKTTTLGLFAAALVSLGQSGGELLNIYSTNLDRAMQVAFFFTAPQTVCIACPSH